MKRFAFTMLELIFVIIVIGILAVLAMPSFNTNPLQLAAEQVATHIRYTQHLAMVDDVYDPTDNNWHSNRWTIDLCQPQYRIARSNDSQTAVDSLTHLAIDGAVNDIFNIATKFSINNFVTSGDCRLIFDNMGRPYTSLGIPATPVSDLLVNNYTITLAHADGNATITIHPETGYVSVTY